MQRWLLGFIVLFGLPGCVIYLDNPPIRYISGRILRADTNAPIAGAKVWFESGRKPFSLFPVDTFGIDAFATTDSQGRFALSAKLNSEVRVVAQNDELYGDFRLPSFPASNRIENVVFKLSRKKPPFPNPRKKPN